MTEPTLEQRLEHLDRTLEAVTHSTARKIEAIDAKLAELDKRVQEIEMHGASDDALRELRSEIRSLKLQIH